jgi:hypothetical protein
MTLPNVPFDFVWLFKLPEQSNRGLKCDLTNVRFDFTEDPPSDPLFTIFILKFVDLSLMDQNVSSEYVTETGSGS